MFTDMHENESPVSVLININKILSKQYYPVVEISDFYWVLLGFYFLQLILREFS